MKTGPPGYLHTSQSSSLSTSNLYSMLSFAKVVSTSCNKSVPSCSKITHVNVSSMIAATSQSSGLSTSKPCSVLSLANATNVSEFVLPNNTTSCSKVTHVKVSSMIAATSQNSS